MFESDADLREVRVLAKDRDRCTPLPGDEQELGPRAKLMHIDDR